MIRKCLVFSIPVVTSIALGLGCSGSGGRSNNKVYYGPGSAPAPVTTQAAVVGCPGDVDGDDAATATQIAPPAPVTGTPASIDCVGDQDYFAVFLTQGTSYDITTANAGGDVRLILVDTDGMTLLGFDETPGGATLTTGPVPVGGIYYVAVTAPSTAPTSRPTCNVTIQ